MIESLFAIDYQVHSARSHDGRATILEQCRRAVEIGLDEIGFSEHKDFDAADPAVEFFDYSLYQEEIAAARREFSPRLAIRMGVEIDYQKWFEDRIRSYLVEHAFDFVIGSVHYVNRAMLMTPAHTAGRSAEQAYRAYFGAIRDSVESGLFDIVGHLEYANRRGLAAYGPYDQAPFREQVGEIFRLMIDRGVALEINTAGLRQGVGTTYPCEAHVALYADMGGRLLTIGSDSHHPDELADGYSFAADLALRHGLSAVYTWQERTPSVRALRTI